jgi:excinuclease ABC subunit C
MVKDSHHRTRAISEEGGEIAISGKRAAFTLISAIQEEVHRYAVSYHRQQRAKIGIGTVLTRIQGVGEARAKALLRHFGSVKAIRTAGVDEIAAVKGVSRPVAEAIVKYFRDNE